MKQENRKEKIEGLTVKKSNFSEWYQQVITKSGLVDYSCVSGCIILRPYAYAIWENIQKFINKKLKASGVKNAYFPLFIPESLLKKESEHIKGFAPEVAWVTEAGNTKLDEKLAIRPTSETIMYDTYAKWIRSWRDLPLRINQWNTIVRWEFKHPTPFLRTREFLWQEGHSAFASHAESEKEVFEILDLYEYVYEKLLAIPVLKGKKTDKEKFPGALATYSVEPVLPDGKAIQGATSHDLGQNFAEAFNIKFLNKQGKKEYVWQTSWGLSTRSIGITIITHGDDKGLIIPPAIAPNKIVIIPIIYKGKEKEVLKKAKELTNKLKTFDPLLDNRKDYTAGWKFNEYELKGIPIRIEIGPKDIAKKQVVLVRRDTNKKEFVKEKDIVKKIEKTLGDIQQTLYNKAKKFVESRIVKAKNIKEIEKAIKQGKIVFANWCGSKKCEEQVKSKTQAKSLNIPFKQQAKGKCAICGRPAKYQIYFGKSY